MKKKTNSSPQRAVVCFTRSTFGAAILSALAFILTSQASWAGSATWNLKPTSGDWNTATNWMPATVPNDPSDTATFDVSNTTSVSLSANTEVNGIAFNPGASAFTITASPLFKLDISGTGIANSSELTQNFVAAADALGRVGVIRFRLSATAGSQTAFTNNGGSANGAFGGSTQFFDSSTAANGAFTTNGGTTSIANGGFTQFFGNSTAGNALFITNGGAVSGAASGFTEFFDDSTADHATFVTNAGAANAGSGGTTFFDNSSAADGNFTTNGGSVSGEAGGVTEFLSSSTAANGTFTTNGGAVSGALGGETEFGGESAAGNATLIGNGGLGGGTGGRIFFFDDSSGGTARVKVFGNGNLDISFRNALGLSVGSIEGDGLVFLGGRNLTVGSNNLNTVFVGVIQDGGFGGGAGGSLTKVGTGRLVLANANTYTGSTTVNGGKLSVNNRTGSGTGSGAVQVNAGRLSGTGLIAGSVTVGTGSGPGAVLAPGKIAISLRPLTIQNTLTFNSDATYNFELNSSNSQVDKIVANGVTVNSGAFFALADRGDGALPPGTVFTVIDNTATTPIAGAFSNLPDNSTFTANGNNFQVSYEGDDGNDLTLTVVP